MLKLVTQDLTWTPHLRLYFFFLALKWIGMPWLNLNSIINIKLEVFMHSFKLVSSFHIEHFNYLCHTLGPVDMGETITKRETLMIPTIPWNRSKPSLASVVACMMPFMIGVCFLCPSMDCLWHKYHYCPSCGEKARHLPILTLFSRELLVPGCHLFFAELCRWLNSRSPIRASLSNQLAGLSLASLYLRSGLA